MAKPKHVKQLGRGILGPMPKALKPRNRKQLMHQAKHEMKLVYKSGFKDLSSQEKRVKAISAKRAQDNKYYLDWLSTQSDQLRAHAAAADTELVNTQNQIQKSAQDSYTALRDQLVEQGGHEGGVSNPAQATAFDVTPEADRGVAQVANERQRTAAAIGTGARQADTAAASNFALMAASDAKRQADTYNALKDIAGSRQKLILDRAAKTAQEVARLLDQEIAKAGTKMQIRGQAGQLALGVKNYRLGKKKLASDTAIARAQLHMDQSKLNETHRHNVATEHNTHRSATLSHHDRMASLKEAERKAHQGDRQAQQEVQRKVKRIVNNGVSALGTHPQWVKLIGHNPNAAVNKLVNHGWEPVFARAAVDLTRYGKLQDYSVRDLKALGFHIPHNWLHAG